MNSDEREAVDDEEQHDDAADADAGASEEQPGPPVGLYLKGNMLQHSYLPASSTLLSPFLKRMRALASKLDLTSHDIIEAVPERRAVYVCAARREKRRSHKMSEQARVPNPTTKGPCND